VTASISVPDAGKLTFREMLDPYFTRIPWAGLGVSLLMGAKIDRPPSPREACFLPADLERAVQTSKNGEINLTADKKVIFAPKPFPECPVFLSPIWVFVTGGILWFGFWLVRRRGHSTAPTAVLLLILGLTGSFILGLSFWTRLWVLHANYNLLWLIPLHFPAGLWLVFGKGSRSVFLQCYLWFAFFAAAAFVFFGFLLPQKFNVAIYPLLIILAWRCALELWPVGIPRRGKDWRKAPVVSETGH